MKHFLITFLFVAQAQALTVDHEVRNGGDSMSISIYRRGDRLMDQMIALKDNCLNATSLTRNEIIDLNERWRAATVDTTPNPIYLEGVYKEGENTPRLNQILVNRADYQMSDEKDVFVMHEILGLKNISDERYFRSRHIVSVLQSSICMTSQGSMRAAEKVEFDLVPTESFLPGSVVWDGRDTVYLLNSDQKTMYRYSLSQRKYLEPVRLRYQVKTMVFAAELNRIYVLSHDGRITFFDLNTKILKEEAFIVAPEAIDQIVVVEKELLLASDKDSWARNYLLSENGKIIHEKDWSHPGGGYTYVSELRQVFYLSHFSPSDLQKIAINSSHIGADKDSPYHGDYQLTLPVVASPRRVVLGSGNIFDAESLQWVGRLPTKIADGIWLNEALLTVNQFHAKSFNLVLWDDKYFESSVREVSGKFVSLSSVDRMKVLLTYLAADGLHFEIIEGEKK